MFARNLARAADGKIQARLVSLDASWSGFARVLRALKGASALVINLPLVAWKRVILLPWLLLLAARMGGKHTVVVLHEWADLNPLRRQALRPYLALVQTVLVSSPAVALELKDAGMGKARDVLPIPPNLSIPAGRRPGYASDWLARQRAQGRLVLAQFGSIYPRKNARFVLDIAKALEGMGVEVSIVFIGEFIKANDNVEAEFRDRAEMLGLTEHVLVTGYVHSAEEIFAIFDAVDVFAYAFQDGLTSRRSSVLACLQAGKPVVVNRPAQVNEFDHHPLFRSLLDDGRIHLVPTAASAAEFAQEIACLGRSVAPDIPDLFMRAWEEAGRALVRALAGARLSAKPSRKGEAAIALGVDG